VKKEILKFKNPGTAIFILMIAVTLVSGCRINKGPHALLWKSDTYNLYTDSVTDHSFRAQIVSPVEIRSNAYQEDRELIFKFCMLSHNDELPLFINHSVLVYPENGHDTLDIKFGKKLDLTAERTDRSYFLEPGTKVTFRLDMNEIIGRMKTTGSTELDNKQRVTAKDLDHIYITGNKPPLTWDAGQAFANENLHLSDPDGDGIYQLTLVFNQTEGEAFTTRKSAGTFPGLPVYTSDQLIVDALYNMSLDELRQLETPDGLLQSAREWPGVWTRDNSYSDMLAMAYLVPERVMACLKSRVRYGKIIQDTGTGGAWPVSTDRVVWITAAWELYKVTGDKDWLVYFLKVAENTLKSDLKVIYGSNGLVMGESSFLDRRRQTYPEWMNPIDIAWSQCLGTNALHYNALKIISLARVEAGLPAGPTDSLATSIKSAVNHHLWLADKGYYAQYIYGRDQNLVSDRSEALGEALCVLFNLADTEKSHSIISRTPVVNYGIPVIFPQTPLSSYYQSDAIWPFVQGYWNWAAATVHNEKALTHGLAALYRAGALFMTNKENMLASNGRIKGLEGNSDAQLWSLSANLAMVFRVFCGMTFETDRLVFNPVIPEVYGGKRSIRQFRYRQSELDITIIGHGTRIRSFSIDGKKTEGNAIPGTLQGKHSIEIRMANNKSDNEPVNITANSFTPATPEIVMNEAEIHWKPVGKTTQYTIWKNGAKLIDTKDTLYQIKGQNEKAAYYQVSATGHTGLVSFLSAAVEYPANKALMSIEAEDFAAASGQVIKGTSGNGFAEFSTSANTSVSLPLEIPDEGEYRVAFRFSNGSGDFTTEDKCALRSLYVDDRYTETLVFPQMGSKGQWDRWEISLSKPIRLIKGKHILKLRLDPGNENTNGLVNDFYLDRIDILKSLPADHSTN